MAWRDSRRSRQRLLLFMSAIVLGIAALVAINSFGDNLARSIDDQARELLGADLTLSWSRAPSPKTQQLLKTTGRDRAYEVSFASLVSIPKTGGVRLAQVKGLQGNFPYYGTWEVQPTSAIQTFRQAASRVALVDDGLLVQLGAQPGDSIKVGNLSFLIAGRVTKTPGQAAIAATVAPTVFVPNQFLVNTGLLQRGSRVAYKYYYQFTPGTDVEKFIKTISARLDKEGVNYDTVDGRKKQTGRSFADLTKYLSLVAFVALLLGCVGVASAVQLYVKEKVTSVAILRTLGASGRQAFLIYLLQTALMGLIGATIGALVGSVVQLVLPRVFGNFLPITVETALSGSAILGGIGTGLLISVLFSLLPLLAIRNVSPLRTLRSSYEDDLSGRDPLRWLVYLLVLGFIVGFAYLQTRNLMLAIGFTAGLTVAFGILTALGLALIWLVRRFFPTSWSYVWRQSLANLYRPNNQTLILVTSIGLGAFLIATLYLTQGLLLGRVELSGSGKQPNMVLFDIQNEQIKGVRALVTGQKLPILQEAPIVTMRLSDINGKTGEVIRKDTAQKTPKWAFTREYRVTYRDSLISSEKLTSGKAPYQADGNVYVSMEKDFFDRMHLKLGDTLNFNVQGAPIQTIVGGTREVEWNRVQTNFLVVFPSGVLEQAPQFHVLMTRVPDNKTSAVLQRGLVSRFPNVSAIDLGLILKTVDEILAQISFVIQFMALFSILTGLLVLASSVVISKYQRLRESVLLRTLGASREQILSITVVEYGLLGLLSALSGILLSIVGTWTLAQFVFEVPYRPDAIPLLVVLLVVTALTVLIGVFNSREVLTRPPLDVLRAEG
ncbi:FtsX-like permease family protein [Spirosoma sp. KCTC 42546]|uniref:ABC transporter permease n=1 Tax=Spirosoma sp. KCTC 42546 TaxID=2520506 RepID=UPI00115A89B9|nr:FtsX-like permease family protein [Spirosoma sp. KCTC 42546]QDK83618.1 FtsX-like permease family protein [Spirosoma sp. KCTC 42546]